MYRDIGMTGTRDGMTLQQQGVFTQILRDFYSDEIEFFGQDVEQRFHHGDCIGADAEGHDIAKEVGYVIVIHPPEKDEVRARCVSENMRP